ncbi:MAG: hypothetical protein JW795_13670 [Chitinivibrionales bacterium]|nr:hypothetical protein [Chitinivibrionales bacterium]
MADCEVLSMCPFFNDKFRCPKEQMCMIREYAPTAETVRIPLNAVFHKRKKPLPVGVFNNFC